MKRKRPKFSRVLFGRTNHLLNLRRPARTLCGTQVGHERSWRLNNDHATCPTCLRKLAADMLKT